MATVRDFEELDVWQMARKLVNEIYNDSSSGAFAKDFALRDQIRRAAVSVMSNIAEGFERGGNAEFVQFLSIAKGSVGEVRSQLYIALDQGYINPGTSQRLQTLAIDVGKKLGGLIAYLKRSGLAGAKYKNSKPETRNPKPESRQAGFSIITAVFVLVVLALLAAFIVSVTGLQSASQQLDVQGVRAYQAARAGVEWGAFQVLDPNNNPATCSPVSLANCPATTDITTLAGSLAPFTVTVRCTFTPTTEGNRDVRVYQITADACNQPTDTSCPNTGTPAQGYVSRQITTVLSKCKDATATPPRCACG